MKQVKMIALLFAAGLLVFSGCKKDENKGTAVEISSTELSADNATLTITFNQAVYKNSDQTGALDASCFTLTFSGTSTVNASYTVSHSAGDDIAIITITYENRLNGDESLEIKVKANTVYNSEGGALEQDLTKTVAVNDLGIIGNWSAYDISAILVSLGFDDSLYAEFKADQSYLVTAYAGGYPITFEGVYTQEKSTYDDIWNITLNQTAQGGQPNELTSQGIFKIFAASPDSMWYEVAQTDPAIAGVTPPTADAGFGSTSGGVLGTMNVQKYLWIKK